MASWNRPVNGTWTCIHLESLKGSSSASLTQPQANAVHTLTASLFISGEFFFKFSLNINGMVTTWRCLPFSHEMHVDGGFNIGQGICRFVKSQPVNAHGTVVMSAQTIGSWDHWFTGSDKKFEWVSAWG